MEYNIARMSRFLAYFNKIKYYILKRYILCLTFIVINLKFISL